MFDNFFRNERLEYVLIKDSDALKNFIQGLECESVIGVDLEADSMFHYHEKICMIQISTPVRNFLIDTLYLDDVSSLNVVFSNNNIRKVFHGSDYDIRSLYRDFNIEVTSLFDTQVAARFLGYSVISLAGLLYEKLGVSLDKKFQKKDWSIRPLPEKMQEYAVLDACYLIPLAGILERELKEKNMYPFFMEECDLQSRVRSVEDKKKPFFLKFKGAGKLQPRNLGILESILQTRDMIGSKLDRPVFKIMSNKQVLDIAHGCPVTEEELKFTGRLSSKQMDMFGQQILKGIHNVLNQPEKDLPRYPRKRRMRYDHGVNSLVNALKEWREQTALSLYMDPVLVLSNIQIQAIANAKPGNKQDLYDIPEINSWKRDFFGNEILGLIKRHA